MEQFTIDGLNVMTVPLKPRICLRLDRKITGLLFHTISGKEKIDLKEIEKTDVNTLLNNFIDSLERLTDDEYMNLVLNLLSSTQVEKNKRVVQISTEESFDEAFSSCKMITIYKVLFRVMQVNRFTPFEVAAETGLLSSIPGLSGNL